VTHAEDDLMCRYGCGKRERGWSAEAKDVWRVVDETVAWRWPGRNKGLNGGGVCRDERFPVL
jgi:hypothetical protein